MSLFLPRRWTRQPQGPVEIDRGHPLGARVVASLLPSMFGGKIGEVVTRSRDISGLVFPTFVGSDGLAHGYRTDTQSPDVRFYDRRIDNDQTFTVASRFSFLPNGGYNGEIVRFGRDYGWYAHVLNYSSTELRVVFGGAWQGAGAQSNVIVVPAGRRTFDCAIVAKLSTAASSSEISHFVNGKSAGSTSGFSTDPGLVTSATARFYGVFAYAGFESFMFVTTIFAGALEPAAIQAIRENPYQIFRPRRPVFYSIPSGTVYTLTTSYQTFELPVTEAEAANITDYSNLIVQVESIEV